MLRKHAPNVLAVTVIITALLSYCSASSQENVPIQSSPTSLPPTVAPSPTSEPPTEIPPTMTLTPTLEVIELNPSPRGYVNMAYDSESGKVILFGGSTGSIGHASNETWAYDVTTNEWANMKPDVSPPELIAASLVYDVESDRVILYGGLPPYLTKLYSDTWVYDFNSNTWTKMVAQGTALANGFQMVYDIESDRIILFAGYYDEFLNDTHVYDFNTDTWMKMEADPAPPGRNYHCMAYNTKADRAVAFGGDVGGQDDISVWAYDFNTDTWEENITNNGPQVRDYCGMVYSAESDKVFMDGGYDSGSSDMWMYDFNSNTWTELNPDVAPGELSRFAFVYIPDLEEIVLFGGQLGEEQFNYTQATWVFDIQANKWTETTRYE